MRCDHHFYWFTSSFQLFLPVFSVDWSGQISEMTENSLENFSSFQAFCKHLKTVFLLKLCYSRSYEKCSKIAKFGQEHSLLEKNAFSLPEKCQFSQQSYCKCKVQRWELLFHTVGALSVIPSKKKNDGFSAQRIFSVEWWWEEADISCKLFGAKE